MNDPHGAHEHRLAQHHDRRDRVAREGTGAEPSSTRKAGSRPTVYVCPMHPQIRRPEPGNCPICGMALEPEVTTAETGPSPELTDMTRRFWIGLALSVPVVALEMGGHLTGLHQWLGQRTGNWIQLLLATPVVLWCGWPF